MSINNYDDLDNYIEEIRKEWKQIYKKYIKSDEEKNIQMILEKRYSYKLGELENAENGFDFIDKNDSQYKDLKEHCKKLRDDIKNSCIFIRLTNNETQLDNDNNVILDKDNKPKKKGFDKNFPITLLKPSRKSTCPLWFIISRLSKLNFNMYISPALYKKGARGSDSFNRRRKENCKSIQSIILDFDFKSEEHKELFEKLKNDENYLKEFFTFRKSNKEIFPNRILMSGNGFHIEFFLDKYFILNSKGQEVFQDIIKGIIENVSSDTACSDCCRYFRQDYSLNVKDEEPKATKTIYLDFKKVYSINQLDYVLGKSIISDRRYKREMKTFKEQQEKKERLKRIRKNAEDEILKDDILSELESNIYNNDIVYMNEYLNIKKALEEDRKDYYITLSYSDINLSQEKQREKRKETRKKKVFLKRLEELNNILIPYRNKTNYIQGYRNNYIFIVANTYINLSYSKERILKECLKVNELFKIPLDELEVMNIVDYAYFSKSYIIKNNEKVFLKELYISNSKIQKLLNITEEEQRLLYHFSYFKEHKDLKKRVYNKMYYEENKERLKRKYKATYKPKMEDKYKKYFQILEENPKANRKELAELMQVSEKQVSRIKKKYKEYIESLKSAA